MSFFVVVFVLRERLPLEGFDQFGGVGNPAEL
jgi:hypothetical protein